MNTQSLERSGRKALVALCASAAFCAALASPVMGQAPAFSINPMRADVELGPGTEKTIAFEVRAEKSVSTEQGRVVITTSEWSIAEDGALTFKTAETEQADNARSATSWIRFSPAALTLQSGRTQLVRITVAAPENARPGTYRTALFIQERPPAAPAESVERTISVRIRFAFLLYVVVTPATAQPELLNVVLDRNSSPPRLTAEMANSGTRHVRPIIFWELRREGAAQAQGKLKSTVLLPSAHLCEPLALGELNKPLEPGIYEIAVNVDFQDGQPQQAMTRSFEVAPKPAVSVNVEFPETSTPSKGPDF